MSLFINTNLSSLQARRAASSSGNRLDVAYERLASGLRINSAKDDAAGVQISNHITTEINGLTMGNRNAQDGISYAQTAEGAIEEITTMLQRIRTLALQASTGTMGAQDRASAQQEVNALNLEITRIARQTTFAGQDLINGNASIVRFQIGTDPNSVVSIDLRTGFDTDSLAVLAGNYLGSTFELPSSTSLEGGEYQYTDCFSCDLEGNGIDISTMSAAQIVIAGIDGLITAVDRKRAEFGALQNRLEASIRNQSNVIENESAARARIRDTDYAETSAEMSAADILQQGAVSILTQANTRPQIALQLLST
ncbi:MAG: flagellin [Succinivibrionaceae bacterium]|nr:flagellin [Succinivibrionaceae bacterium]